MLLPNLREKVAPVATGDEEVECLELGLDAQAPLQDVRVERVVRLEPDARKAVLVLPGEPLQALLRFGLLLLSAAHGWEKSRLIT